MRNWVSIIKLIIGVTLFVGLIWFIDPVKIWRDIREIGRFDLLFVGAFFFLIGLVPVQAMKFHFLLKSASSGATFRDSMRIVMIGFLFNNFLPTNVGGDVIKSYLFKKKASIGWGRIVGLVTLERIVGVVILILYGFLFLLVRGLDFFRDLRAMEWETGSVGTWLIVIAFGFILLLIASRIIFPQKSRDLLQKGKTLLLDSWQGVKELKGKGASGLAFFALLFHLCRVSGYFFFLMAMGQTVLFQDLAFAVVFTSFVSLIPVSVGALGVKEGGLAIALSLFTVPFDIGITVGVLNRGMLFLVSLIGLLYYFSSSEREVLKERAEEEEEAHR